jgi:amino acid adenylation domain-containing protein
MKVKASYHQERLWFIDQFEAGNVYDSSPIYHNIPLILEIEGAVDTRVLEQSFRSLIKRHEALHTKIITENNEPLQWIDPQVDFRLEIIDLSGNKDEPGHNHPLHLAMEKVKRPFSLAEDLLIRAAFIRITHTKCILAVALHHIISDKFSLSILLGDLLEYYDAYLNQRPPRLKELPLQYADFSQWQHQLPAKVIGTLLFYWKRQLSGQPAPLELPIDRTRASIHKFEDESLTFTIPPALSERIKDFSRQNQVSSFVVLLAVLKILFQRYTGQEEIVLGTSVDNRNQPGTDTIIGPIANLLVLRSRLASTSSLNQVLTKVNKTVNNAYKHRDIPFDRLVLELEPNKDMSRTALFDVLFQYEEKPGLTYTSGNLSISVKETNLGWGKYDLNLLIREDDVFSGIMVYNKLYYNDTTISRLIDHYVTLLEGTLENPQQPAAEISYLTEAERKQLLIQWTQTRAHYPRDKTLRQIFREQVERAPHQAALLGSTGIKNMTDMTYISYGQLHEESNHVARLLQEKGIHPDTIVGIMMERSVEMIIGMLGILKAGGAYLPIDPGYPGERIDYMLKDAKVKILVKNSNNFGDSPSRGDIDVIFIQDVIDRNSPKGTASHLHLAPWINAPADSLAYIIYTSGTTGKPKGCMISHKNVVRLLKNDKHPFDFGARDVWIMAHSFCFDFSVWEIYGALLYGGRLVIPGWGSIRDTGIFLSMIKKQKVTVLNQTPLSFYNLAAEEKKSASKTLDQHLRYVIFGGDRLTPAYLKDWVQRYPLTGIRLINMFGITETTVHVTYYQIKEEDIFSSQQSSPIGAAIPETSVYIFDNHLHLVPVGVTGEIYVGGSGVARGYLNRVILTLRRFIENPYRQGETLYKSGDLGKWLADGTIHYMGRNDSQVKIRGYRVELGEIKSRLTGYRDIREVEVMALGTDAGDIDLCAYFAADTELGATELKEYLARDLPGYMIPTYFMQVDRIPLTSNGKVDRKSLPEPYENIKTGVQYVEPRNDAERIIVDTWKEILKVDKVSIHDNFFELGGNSIKIMHVIGKLKELFQRDFQVLIMFRYTTIESLARYINQEESREDSLAHNEERYQAEDKKRSKLKNLKKKMREN